MPGGIWCAPQWWNPVQRLSPRAATIMNVGLIVAIWLAIYLVAASALGDAR